MRPRVSRKPSARPLQSQCRLSSFCSRVFSPALFLCSVPRGIPRVSFFFSPASDAGFLRFVRGSLAPRCFFVLFPAVFRVVSFFFSPASDAGFSLFCAPPCISAPVSILPWRIALTWQFEREEPRGAMLRPRLLSGLFVCLFPGIGCRCSSPSMER